MFKFKSSIKSSMSTIIKFSEMFIAIPLFNFIYNKTYAMPQNVEGLEKLNQAGTKILHTFINVGYWVVLVVGISSIIKLASKNDRKGVVNAITTSLIMYGALFFLPWALNLVEGIF